MILFVHWAPDASLLRVARQVLMEVSQGGEPRCESEAKTIASFPHGTHLPRVDLSTDLLLLDAFFEAWHNFLQHNHVILYRLILVSHSDNRCCSHALSQHNSSKNVSSSSHPTPRKVFVLSSPVSSDSELNSFPLLSSLNFPPATLCRLKGAGALDKARIQRVSLILILQDSFFFFFIVYPLDNYGPKTNNLIPGVIN